MKFRLKCKVCGKELAEGSDLRKHILTHDPIMYFDVVPAIPWYTKKPKPPEPPEEIEEEVGENDIEEDIDEEGG